MKRFLFILATCALLCACGSKSEQKQCPYDEEEFVIRSRMLHHPDTMDHYAALAAESDARGQYVMAASYYCFDDRHPIPAGVKRVYTEAEADSLLDAAAAQGYKPAIKARDYIREHRGEK